ncbi:2-amino-4-hydroxy-6-hydroxymethyldihydropteridine diphosphokinase [Helicobacter monodelphidis]|uniref:2-amino-4-hydroxy-6- hydroxymethyldihydropteridine diphosphokinase n=1 Tax=Helicobacter sp. 15-1451 TaxID=2004995 RepID=UPI000DCB5560|nr:2-amino-4-hydroxy-6-hydroxymethyldihydropteridine diphosphokinase [Helicobacter sp. 15-1451]RAX58125.1 2-amino-4-hydroxy-6-hydroxymethyldihydropteridine diphosphokinase [Helicobacter sp. 15-1451]
MVSEIPKVRHIRYDKMFPLYEKEKCAKRFEVVIGVGGNCGDTIGYFQSLVGKLKENSHIEVLSTSPLYYNPPFGYEEQEWFYNATIRVKTSYGYKDFFAYTSYLERRFNRPRKRLFKDAPRTLDIDIIAFGRYHIQTPTLTIPHKAWKQRESVIIPLWLEMS